MAVAYYFDESVNRAICLGLRLRGVEVITAQEDGKRATDDNEILRRATTLKRPLVTADQDFSGDRQSQVGTVKTFLWRDFLEFSSISWLYDREPGSLHPSWRTRRFHQSSDFYLSKHFEIMYHKAYGIIETLAPLHVGASAAEETGNLNLIFRDQFTQTGIIPGSSIRGRFRADMRQEKGNYGDWYGKEAVTGQLDSTSEGIVKFEYASILWLPIYCPSQPIVRVTCPILLKRYQKLAGKPTQKSEPYSYYVPPGLKKPSRPALFFNLGCLPLKKEEPKLKEYIPEEIQSAQEYIVFVVKDTEMATIHNMALYRQSRVALKEEQKTVAGTSFFNVEALPEGTILVFPMALRSNDGDANFWEKFVQATKMSASKELYFGGLESVGFGRTNVILKETAENPQKEEQA